MNSNYERYKHIKMLLSANRKGLELDKALAMDIAMLCFNAEQISYSKIALFFLKVIPATSLTDCFKKEELVLTSYFKNRKDYKEQIELTIKSLKSVCYVQVDEMQHEFYVDLRNFFYSIRFINKRLKSFFSFRERLYLAARLCYVLNSVQSLDKAFENFNLNGKKYLAFHSSIGIEAVLCLFFNARGVKTFTLSHGMSYVAYNKEIPLDAIAGDNITAGRVLVWGNSSKRDLIRNFKFPEERIWVAGNLKYPLRHINVKQSFCNGIVLLGRKIYNEGNLLMLRIAANLSKIYGISFKAKLHPALDKDFYSRICKQYNIELIETGLSVTECLGGNEFDFALVNNSTSYYEAMYYNLICFRYGPDVNEQFLGLDDLFDDEETLLNKIELFKKWETKNLNEIVSSLLIDTIGMGINEYGKIFQ